MMPMYAPATFVVCTVAAACCVDDIDLGDCREPLSTYVQQREHKADEEEFDDAEAEVVEFRETVPDRGLLGEAGVPLQRVPSVPHVVCKHRRVLSLRYPVGHDDLRHGTLDFPYCGHENSLGYDTVRSIMTRC